MILVRYVLVLLAWLGVAAASAQEVRVAAASSLRPVVEELAEAFARARPDATLSVAYGASGTLVAEIAHGAPFDVFLAADDRYPRELERLGRVEPGTRTAYATGRLAVWAHDRLGLPEDATAAEVLASPRAGRIAVASPDHAPYGVAALEALASLGLREAVEGRLVRAENVAQAAQIALRSGGVGIVARPLARTPRLVEAGRAYEVPRDAYRPLRHEAVLVAGRDGPEARAFLAFLASDPARAVLEARGFDPP